jgi:hypothetical protein
MMLRILLRRAKIQSIMPLMQILWKQVLLVEVCRLRINWGVCRLSSNLIVTGGGNTTIRFFFFVYGGGGTV